jgi:hypothetical protein
MNPSDAAKRVYLESRRETLLALQVQAYHRAVTARNQAADLAPSRACRKELARLRQVAQDAQDRCDQFTRALRVLEAELSEAEAL